MTGDEEALDQVAPSDARQTLLRALDHLDQIQDEFGEPKNTYLIVAYAHQVEGQTVRGWASTDDPTFITVALMRDVADYIEGDNSGGDEPGGDEG